jgi:hypothetical protein
MGGTATATTAVMVMRGQRRRVRPPLMALQRRAAGRPLMGSPRVLLVLLATMVVMGRTWSSCRQSSGRRRRGRPLRGSG